MAHEETPSREDGTDDLWARVHRREPDAERIFCDLAGDIARRFFRQAGGDCDDLVQKTVISAALFAQRDPTPPRDLRAFLQWRCRGVLSGYRKARRRRPKLQDADLSLFPDEVLAPGEQRQLRKDLLDCIDKLVPPLSDVFRDRCAGIMMREIARSHGKDPAWATRTYASALEALRRCMERKGHSA